jgi:flavodoxin
MPVLIVCISKEHGSTQKVAEVLAGELNATILQPDEVDVESLSDYDLIGFGSGIRIARHYRELRDLVTRIPKQQQKRSFIFSTSGLGSKMWHSSLRKHLVRKGCIIQDEFWCKGIDTYGLFGLLGGVNKGRPNEQDLAEAADFARRLLNG